MAAIRSYTTVEQSRKLAEILPLESADMYYFDDNGGEPNFKVCNGITYYYDSEDCLCCWSLTALLDIMPKDKSVECSISFGYYNGKGKYIEKWLCAFEKEGETTNDYIIETIDGDNPIDACVTMIEKLHELNLL